MVNRPANPELTTQINQKDIANKPPLPIQQIKPDIKPDTKIVLKPNKTAKAEPKPFVPASFLKTLTDTAHSMGITDSNDLANFLAQCNVETNNWKKSTESFNYSTPEVLRNTFTSRFPNDAVAQTYIKSGEVATANRALSNKNGNGDEASGDGWRYRGRGFLHLTGRELYAKAGEALHPKNPTIYVNHPEILSTNPKYLYW
jgi:putative chitinase